MAQESTPLESKRKHIGGDLVIPLAALVFTIYYFSTIIGSPWTAQVSAYFVGTILILLIAILGVKSVIALKRGEADLGMSSLLAARPYLLKRLTLLALTIGFILVVDWAGFTLTTFVFLALAMLLLSEGRNRGFILLLSAMLALGGYLLFILAFDTRFPAGPFENLMKQVL